jgi:protein ImuB
MSCASSNAGLPLGWRARCTILELESSNGQRTNRAEELEVAVAMTNRAGIPVDVAIAGDPDSASFAARGFRGMTIVRPGQEGAILSPLPLHLLPCSPEVAAILNAWGIRTFGAFAALPPAGVVARLGKEGSYLQLLVRGQGHRQLRPIEDPPRFEEELELESPVELLESLAFVLGRMLHDLCGQLKALW